MECEELREELGEWRRGQLSRDAARELERHLSICPECGEWERDEREVSRLLTERLPRHAAPAWLSRRVHDAMAPRVRHAWWWAASAAVATAMLMVLLLLPSLPRSAPADPLQPIVRAVLSQHTRILLWSEVRPEAVPARLPRLMEETRIGLSRVFMGDDEVRLLGVEPVVFENRWGLAFFYEDPEGHTVTLVVLPGQGLSVPDRNRVPVQGFRPMLSSINGFSVFVWKQGPLAFFLISDLVSERDLTRFRQHFLRVRSATEPAPSR